MKKIYPLIILITILSAYGVFVHNNRNTSNTAQESLQATTTVENISYTIKNEVFTLRDGKEIREIKGQSLAEERLSIFGKPLYGDLTGDGKDDAALLLEHSLGSKQSYYAVLAIASGTTYISTNTLYLGDDVSPQTYNINDGRAVFNYAVRKGGEPLSIPPSIGKSLYIYYNPKDGQIGELAKDFEGESAE